MTDDLSHLDATAQAALVRSGEVTPLELVDAAIERVERVNPRAERRHHAAVRGRRAQAASDRLPDGPLRGVPFALKDLSAHSAGDPFHEGMAFLKERGWTEPEDTVLAARFRAAGLVTVGKTNTPELGILPTTEPVAYGPTRNPWDTSRSTGGSSGGSAAAVAAGMVPIAHANDGGGSIRIPASECGLVGLKPTRARVSSAPEFGDVMGGLTCELVVSRSVRDTALVLDAVHGMAPGDPYTAPDPARPFLEEVGAAPGRLRIGLMTAEPGRRGAGAPRLRRGRRGGRAPARVARARRRRVPPEGPRRPRVHGPLHHQLGGRARPGTSTTGRGAPVTRSAPRTWSRSPGRSPRWAGRATPPSGSGRGSGSR